MRKSIEKWATNSAHSTSVTRQISSALSHSYPQSSHYPLLNKMSRILANERYIIPYSQQKKHLSVAQLVKRAVNRCLENIDWNPALVERSFPSHHSCHTKQIQCQFSPAEFDTCRVSFLWTTERTKENLLQKLCWSGLLFRIELISNWLSDHTTEALHWWVYFISKKMQLVEPTPTRSFNRCWTKEAIHKASF